MRVERYREKRRKWEEDIGERGGTKLGATCETQSALPRVAALVGATF